MENIGTSAGFCSQTVGIWQAVGYFLMVFKIVLPIILIIIGIITFGKAVISDDDKEIKKGYTSLLKKLIVCIIAFFLPQIITSIFNIIVDDFKNLKPDYDVCKTCIVSPNGNKCESYIEQSHVEDEEC
jgi:fumarate reductase subunit D